MHRASQNDTDAPSHDSFLDVVANMVGILIILVMVVGVRVKNAPVTAAIPGGAESTDRQLEADLAAEQSLREEVLSTADQIRSVEKERLVRGQERDLLATVAETLKQQIQSRRDQLDSQAQGEFDLARRLSDSKVQLEDIRRERARVQRVRAKPILVESYPTPLSQTVDDHEAHFQLRGGHVALIPLSALVAELKEDAQRQKYKLADLPELTNTVGPIRGFRLRYTLRRHDISPEMAMISGRGGSFARMERWTLIPISSQLGESVEMALAEGSEFRQALSAFRPGRDTITIWTYPDSFASFRHLKRELFRLGYSTAARPLPLGTPISGSPQGSKSAAQ